MESEEKNSPEKICSKCSHLMEAGVIADNVDYFSTKMQTWIAGIQKKNFSVFGFSGKKKSVLTFRCIKCGFLESYAP